MYKFLLTTLCLLFAFSFSISAQTDIFKQNYQEKLEETPSDLTFNISFKDNKNKFRQGEVIPVQLQFTSSTPDKYEFSTRNYDRGGRLHMDGFNLDKANGAVDPLDDYFSKKFGLYMMGGLFSPPPTLYKKTQILNYEINEWLRFDKTGKYRIYISSPRVSYKKQKDEEFRGLMLFSNILEFEILPADEEWQKKKLAEAIAILDSTKEEEKRKPHCLTLRYLGTKEAAREIIKRFGSEDPHCSFDFFMGLQGSPEREFIVREMEQMMQKSDFPVTNNFLHSLSLLSYFHKNPEPLPTYSETDTAANKLIKKEIERLRKLKQKEFERFTELLAIYNKKKTGIALAISTDTLIRYSDSSKTSDVVDSFIKVFFDLPTKKQRSLLEHRWDKMNSQKILPILQNLYRNFNGKYKLNYENRSLLEITIKRLYELSPEEGRQIILAEMRSAKPRISNRILMLLPDKEITDFEEIWIEKAINENSGNRPKYAQLLERFGSANALPYLQTTYENRMGDIRCDLQESLIRYFLKHDTVFATEMIRKALDTSKRTKCYNSVFENIPTKYWSKEIEQIAVSQVENENIGLVKTAIDILGENGSQDVKKAIWRRFEKFSNKLKNDESAFTKRFGDYSFYLYRIEQSFIEAIAKSHNWLTNKEELKKLSNLCLTKACRNDVQSLEDNWGTKINPYFPNNEDKNKAKFSIAHYHSIPLENMKLMLSQFPQNTTFTWSSDDDSALDKILFEEISKHLEENGMKLMR